MRTITGEPSAIILQRIYDMGQCRSIIVNGRRGHIEAGCGGYGNPAILVSIGDERIVARERESEDYTREQDGNAPLELYKWEREDTERYYHTLADALADCDGNNRAL